MFREIKERKLKITCKLSHKQQKDEVLIEEISGPYLDSERRLLFILPCDNILLYFLLEILLLDSKNLMLTRNTILTF